MIYVIFIGCHVMRFNHAGKVCSGDYIEKGSTIDKNDYLIATGEWIFTYIIMAWLIVPITLFLLVCMKGKQIASFALTVPK